MPSITNEELGNTVDELSANLTESASTEEIVGKILAHILLKPLNVPPLSIQALFY